MFFRPRKPTIASSISSPMGKSPNSNAGSDEFQLPPEVEQVMDSIKNGWEFMTSDDYNPVTLALELLDNTSQSRELNSFFQLMERLEKAMEIIVNDHYQAFNNSIETFSRVTDSIADSRNKVTQLRTSLLQCQSLLQTKRPDLFDVWIKSVQYKEMLRMLETIEELKSSPERIEKWVLGKYYLSAVKDLLASLKTMEGGGFAEIHALSDIKANLREIKATMHEHIIEDLHSIIYMQFPQCDRINFKSIRNTIDETASKQKNLGNAATRSSNSNKQSGEPTDVYTAAASAAILLFEDLDANPRDDPLLFMEITLSVLEMLGKLNDTVKTVKQRLPFELFKITDAIILQCEEKWHDSIKYAPKSNKYQNRLALTKNGPEVEVLKEFLNQLYEKLLRVTEMHKTAIATLQRVLQRSLSDRTQNKPAEATFIRYTLMDLWSAIQNEIISILSSYLIDAEQGFISSTMTSAGGDNSNMQNKSLFKFSESDLVKQNESAMKSENSVGVIDVLSGKNEAAVRKLPIEPSVFYISHAFGPTLSFVETIEKYLMLSKAEKKSEILTFLEGLLTKYLIPQIEDTITQRFNESMNAIDSFRIVPSTDDEKTNIPIMKSTLNIIDILKDICIAVYNIPVYQNEFVRIAEKLIAKYYEKVIGKFKSTIAPQNDETPIPSSVWIQDKSLLEVLHKNVYLHQNYNNENNPPAVNNADLALKEYEICEKLRNKKPIAKAEIISDASKLEFFANLRTSIRYFVDKMESMVKVDIHKEPHIAIRSFSDILGSERELNMNSSEDNDQYQGKLLRAAASIVFDEAGMKRFKSCMQNFVTLADNCLFLLRKELHSHVLHYLELMIKEGNYQADSNFSEPDIYVTTMNSDLIKFQQAIANSLPIAEQKFVFDEISVVINDILMEGAKTRRISTNNGILKMIKNIAAIQQCLNYICDTNENYLDSSRKFYEVALKYLTNKPK